MKCLLSWLTTHWVTIAEILAFVAIPTLITRWLNFYGAKKPRVAEFLRFILSILAALPVPGGISKGIRLMIGRLELQLPLFSYTAAPRTPTRAGLALPIDSSQR